MPKRDLNFRSPLLNAAWRGIEIPASAHESPSGWRQPRRGFQKLGRDFNPDGLSLLNAMELTMMA